LVLRHKSKPANTVVNLFIITPHFYYSDVNVADIHIFIIRLAISEANTIIIICRTQLNVGLNFSGLWVLDGMTRVEL